MNRISPVKRHRLHNSRSVLAIISMSLLLLAVMLGVNVFTQSQQPTAQAQQARTITDNITPPVTPGIQRFLPQQQATPIKTLFIAHVQLTPTLAPISQTTDLNSILNQINQTNSSIVSNMYTCVRQTQQVQSQVVQFRVTEKQLQDEIEQLKQQERALVPTDPNTPTRRAELRKQRDQLYTQLTQVLNTISQTKRQYYTEHTACTTTVYNQQKAKRTLEYRLEDAFRNASNARFN